MHAYSTWGERAARCGRPFPQLAVGGAISLFLLPRSRTSEVGAMTTAPEMHSAGRCASRFATLSDIRLFRRITKGVTKIAHGRAIAMACYWGLPTVTSQLHEG